LGDVGVFSFFGNKVVTTGEGGVALTKEPRLAAIMRQLRDHGMAPSRRYWHDNIGYNYRLTNLQAAVGVAQLDRIDEIIGHRERIRARYEQGLASVPLQERVNPEGCSAVCWLHSIVFSENAPAGIVEYVRETLAAPSIDTRPFFHPLHRMPPFKSCRKSSLSNSVSLAARGLTLPTYSALANSEIDRICELIDAAVHKYASRS
jgi:perosamine synthetase